MTNLVQIVTCLLVIAYVEIYQVKNTGLDKLTNVPGALLLQLRYRLAQRVITFG